MTSKIVHKGVELLGWPSFNCLGCYFYPLDRRDCPRKGSRSLKCLNAKDHPPTVIWLTKEEWLKRRIKE